MEKRGRTIAGNDHDAARHTLHQAQRQDGTKHRNRTRRNVRDERRGFAETGFLEHFNAVVHDRVDAGQLLARTNQNTDEQDAHEPAAHAHALFTCRVVLGGCRLRLQGALNVGNFGFGTFGGADALHDLQRLLTLADAQQPARRLGHTQHADEQADGGQGADGEHPAPHPVVLTPYVADKGVYDERGELAAHDHEFVAAGEGATNFVGCELREEYGHHGGGATDRQAEQGSSSDEHGDVGCKHAGQGANEEDGGQPNDGGSAAVPVRDTTTGERANSRREGERSGDPALGGGVHAEFAAHGFERAVDHSGVVAEEQTAEGGDECNDAEVSAVLPGAQRGQGGGGALCAHGVL